MTAKTKQFILALFTSGFLQFMIIYRTMREHDALDRTGVWGASTSFYVLKVVFIVAALLVLLPVFRQGNWWQRILAGLFCVLPVVLLVMGAVEGVEYWLQD